MFHVFLCEEYLTDLHQVLAVSYNKSLVLEKYAQEKKLLIASNLVTIIIWVTMRMWETWKWRGYMVV